MRLANFNLILCSILLDSRMEEVGRFDGRSYGIYKHSESDFSVVVKFNSA